MACVKLVMFLIVSILIEESASYLVNLWLNNAMDNNYSDYSFPFNKTVSNEINCNGKDHAQLGCEIYYLP